MIVVQITGGLGNQMFQYAAAKSLSLHHKVELRLDLQSFKREILPELEVPRAFELTVFENFSYTEATLQDIKSFNSHSWLQKRIQKILPPHKRKVYLEKQYPFDKNFYRSNKHIYLKGHRQTEKYFARHAEEVRRIYQIKHSAIADVEGFASEVRGFTSVAVHVRRGDYLRLPIILNWHGVLSKEYYLNALQLIKSKFNNPRFFYFSDDIEWVEKELCSSFPGIIVSNSISKTHLHDFYLMQSCKHQIIANSTFSWWAAWMNPNPEKIVIAPKKWFNKAPYDTRDLIPESWISI